MLSIFQNPFITSILVPLIFVGIAGLIEMLVAFPNNNTSKDHRYVIWIEWSKGDNKSKISRLPDQSISNIMNQKAKILDIEPMFTFNAVGFINLAIDLVIGALSFDVSILIGGTNRSSESIIIMGYMIVAHLCLLIFIILSIMFVRQIPPDKEQTRNKVSLMAIVFGLTAMFTAVLALYV